MKKRELKQEIEILKQEIKNLESEKNEYRNWIEVLIKKPNTYEAAIIKTKYDFLKDLERCFFI